MSYPIPDDLIHAAFFFVDIVGLSNPILSTETQRTKIKVLNEKIYSCETCLSYKQEDLFILPTGDGMLIGFKDGLEEPIKLAEELNEKLKKYNETCPSTEIIQVRIGCNVGHIFVIKDMKNNLNLWGPGAILARRVMDLGDENHVLVTSSMAEDLIETSEKYSKILHPVQDYKIKHEEEILLYSAYNEHFGNPNIPRKTVKNVYNENETTAKNAICEKIIFNIILKAKNTNFLTHERTYHISNYEIEPIYEFIIGILTDSEHKFDELDMHVFEDGIETKISKIFSPSLLSKQVLVKFLDPIITNGKKTLNIRYYTKELTRHFEHVFLNECKKAEFNFTFSSYSNQIKPQLYKIDNNIITKTIIEQSGVSTNGLSTKTSWAINHVNKKDLIRLEW